VHPYSEDLLLSTKDILTITFNYSNSDTTFLGINRTENVNNSPVVSTEKQFLKNILLTLQYQCVPKNILKRFKAGLEDGGQYLRDSSMK
jgi:hypothetical protein